MRRANALEKPLMLRKAEQKGKRAAAGEMVRERHQLREREFERTLRQWTTGEPGALQSTGSKGLDVT